MCCPLATRSTQDVKEAHPTFLLNASADLKYSFAVIKRVLGVFYGIAVEDVLERLQPGSHLKLPVGGDDLKGTLARSMIRAAVIHVVRAANRHRSPREPKVSTVVVMQDESVQADDTFSQLDVSSTLRSALLDTQLDSQLNVAVVMTALKPSALGQALTAPGRAVIAVVLPQLLPNDVVERWWRMKGDRGPALLVAAAVKDLPRQVEVFYDLIREKKLPLGPGSRWTAGDIKSLFDACKAVLNARYQTTNVKVHHVRAIVFGQFVRSNKRSLKAISDSTYVNSLPTLDVKASVYFTPRASLTFLSAVVTQTANDRGERWAVLLRDFLDQLVLARAGDALEWALEWWLELRLAVLHASKPRPDSFPLVELLGLVSRSSQASQTAMETLPSFRKMLFFVGHPVAVKGAQSRSLRDAGGVAALVQDVSRHARAKSVHPLLFRPWPGEPFDLLLVVREASEQQLPFLVFFDCKARAPDVIEPSRSSFRPSQAYEVLGKLGDFGEQLRTGATGAHAVTITPAPEAESAPAEDGDANSRAAVAAAIAARRYVFVYVSTEPGETDVIFTRPRDDPLVLMRCDTTEPFFGPLWDVHQALRGAFVDPPAAPTVVAASASAPGSASAGAGATGASANAKPAE